MKTKRIVLLIHLLIFFSLVTALSISRASDFNELKILNDLRKLKSIEQIYADNEYKYSADVAFRNELNIKKNIILISIDTLRADRLNCYGYKRRVTSPNIDKLSEDGFLFENCYASSPGTLSSQMSLLTGYYPTVHGITYRNAWDLYKRYLEEKKTIPIDYYVHLPSISERIYTLAEILKVHGFHTIGIHEGGYLSAPLGYSSGFDRFLCSQSWGEEYAKIKVTEGIKKTFSILRDQLSLLKTPFFLFLHTYEPHDPYIHEKYAILENHQDKQREYFSACYDSGILYTDEYIGSLLSLLKERNLIHNTILIITSDHGEEFGDHYPIWYGGHGQSQYQELKRVPLIIFDEALNHLKNKGIRNKITENVESVDILPTILEMVFGMEYSRQLLACPGLERNGRSLLSLIYSKPLSSKPIYFEDSYYGPERIGIILSDYELIVKKNPNEQISPRSDEIMKEFLKAAEREMFFLKDDPGETRNIFEKNRELGAKMERHILGIREKLEKQHQYFSLGNVKKLDEEQIEKLKSLGYVQ